MTSAPVHLLIWISFFSLLLSGCSALPKVNEAHVKQLLSWQSSSHETRVVPSLDELLHVTPDMKRFVQQHVHGKSSAAKIKQLTRSLIEPEGLGLQYNGQANGSAQEVFRSRQSNCLSFALLILALSNYMGVEARANLVEIPLSWDVHARDALITYRHINVQVIGTFDEKWIVDLTEGIYNRHYKQEVLSDDDLLSLVYSNFGVEAMLRDELHEAYYWYIKSLALNSADFQTWSNLGILMRRLGETRLAETAF